MTDLKRSDTFYGGMLGPLGMSERWHFKAQAGYPDLTGFGEPGIPGFWLKASKTTRAELYVAFAARNEAAVRGARAGDCRRRWSVSDRLSFWRKWQSKLCQCSVQRVLELGNGNLEKLRTDLGKEAYQDSKHEAVP